MDYTKTFMHYRVPPQNHEGLELYVRQGIRPGSFLQSVLENDLREAFARADHVNQWAMVSTLLWLFNEAPSACWGSPGKVAAWIERGGLEGR